MTELKQNSERSDDVTETISSELDLIEEGYWGQLCMSKLNDDNSDEFPIEINLKGNNISFGRKKTCDICIPTNKISDNHGKIVKENDNNGNELIYFVDESGNGTWINKVRILKSKALIKDGDEIVFVPASKKKERKKLAYTLKIFDPTSKYEIGDELGSGSYGDVLHVIHKKTLKPYAMKRVDKKKWNRYKNCFTKRPITILDEGNMMQQMKHPGIIKMKEYFQTDDYLIIILELCAGGDLFDFINKKGTGLSEKIAADLFMQIVLAVHYVHTEHEIAHRDLKPENILLNKDASILKLGDFGMARTVTTNDCKSNVGTPLYQAPEVNKNINDDDDDDINSEGSTDYDEDRYYDGKIADYWSLGLILYFMILGCHPATKQETIVKYARNKNIEWCDNVSNEAKTLIYGLLTVDPTKRMTYNDIIKHEWIKKNCSLYNKESIINETNNDTNKNVNDDEKSNINMETDNNISITNKKRTRNNECMDDIARPKTKKYKTDPTFIRY